MPLKSQPQLGDYGCVHTPGFVGKLIRFFLKSKVNHAFVYIGDGNIVEANPTGAAISPLSNYDNVTWSHEKLTKEQRTAICSVAQSLVGTPYGFLDIFFLWLDLLGIQLNFVANWVKRSDRMICSQLVAYCYRTAHANLCDKPDYEVTPDDLYRRALNAY